MPSPPPPPTSLSTFTPVVEPSPSGYRRLLDELGRLEASLPPSRMSRKERDALRQRGAYAEDAMYACAALAQDPFCTGRRLELTQEVIDAKLAHVAEAKRLARALRRLARQVTDDALVVAGDLATEAMQTLDLVDALSALRGGEHLRTRVDEARALVRRHRPARRKKAAARTPPKP